MQRKIKVVAIAKDEAPYIAEWVFHHLHFGFDEIEILVNRTTDNSQKILERISTSNSALKWRYVDWVDLVEGNVSRDIQKIAYALAYSGDKDNFSHILFIDIDEFWTPANFRDTIGQCMEKLGDPDAVYFEWLAEDGHNKPFSQITNHHTYKPHSLGKTIINTRSNVKKLSIHRHFLNSNNRYLLANGNKFVPSEASGQALRQDEAYLKDYFVIHRMARSEEEYISLIYRGNPEHVGKFKDNRHGYHNFKSVSVTVDFDSHSWSDYVEKRERFFLKIDANSELHTARELVLEKYRDSLHHINESLMAGNSKLSQTLFGLSERHGFSSLGSMKYKGQIDRASSGRLAGWAVGIEGAACLLRIFVNGKMVSETLTDKKRNDLLAKKLSKGEGGFDLDVSGHIKSEDNYYSIAFEDDNLLGFGRF